MVPLPLEPGDPRRLGGYELIGRLGVGGQGVVYLGCRPSGPRVAVKLLHARLLADAQARARFVRELAVLQRVAGFCTAQMLEADMAGDQPYIVSEYVPGPSLRELVADRGPRTGADLDRLAISSVTALAAIHRAGIVHRDFKPHNVLIGPDGPRVIDFGIARALDAGTTLTSQIIGTPAFMAPEQFGGGAIGPAADLFAWGATMVFAATGRGPFDGGPLPAVMYRILHEDPDLSALPPQIARVVSACLNKNPGARPTAEEALLRLLGADTPAAPPQDTPPERPPVLPGRGPDIHGQTTPMDSPSSAGPANGSPGASEAFPPGRGRVFADPYEPGGLDTTLGYDRPTGGHAPARPPAPAGADQGRWTRRWPEQDTQPRRALRRTPSLAIGLLLALLLAVLDITALGFVIADPALSGGRPVFVIAAGIFTLLSAVTIVAAAAAWRGSRPAVWTVIGFRTLREGLWAVWGVAVLQAEHSRGDQLQAYSLHLVATLTTVALLVRALHHAPHR